MSFDKYNDVIKSIYKTSIDSQHWKTALQDISSYFQSEGAGLYIQNPHKQEVKSISFMGLRDGFLASYADNYGQLNPTFKEYMELCPGVIFSEQVFNKLHKDEGFYNSTTFYNEWMQPQDYAHAAGGTLMVENNNMLHFTLLRSARQGVYTAQELKVLKAFSQHLCKAVEFSTIFEQISYRMKSAEHLLSCMGHGIIILDSQRQVLEANQPALNCIEESEILSINQGKLNSAHLGFLKLLNTELAQTMVNTTLNREIPLRLNVPDCHSFFLILMPIPPQFQAHFNPQAAILIVKKTTPENPINQEYLQKNYDLSPSEARLTKYLVEGYELKRAAYETGVSYETARWYLKSIFEKTDTHRQIDLILKINIDPVSRYVL